MLLKVRIKKLNAEEIPMENSFEDNPFVTIMELEQFDDGGSSPCDLLLKKISESLISSNNILIEENENQLSREHDGYDIEHPVENEYRQLNRFLDFLKTRFSDTESQE